MKLLLLFILSIVASAQTAVFPGSVVTDAQLKVAANNLQTTLRAAISGTETTMDVANSSGIVPNMLLTIDTEIVNVTAVSGTVLTVQRGFDGTTAVQHAYGARVSAFIARWHHKAVAEEIKAIETVVAGLGTSALPPSLAANGANCPAGYAAGGVSASGVAEDCQPVRLGPMPWSRTLGVDITGAISPALVTLTTACPIGIEPGTPVRITGGSGGADFTARVLDGSCIGLSDGSSGTIMVRSPVSKSGGVTIASGTDGLQEMISSATALTWIDARMPAGEFNLWGTLHFAGRSGSLTGAGPWGTILLNQTTTQDGLESGYLWPRTKLSRAMNGSQTEFWTYTTRGITQGAFSIEAETLICTGYSIDGTEGHATGCTRGQPDGGGVATVAATHAIEADVFRYTSPGTIGTFTLKGFALTGAVKDAYVGNASTGDGIKVRSGYVNTLIENVEVRNHSNLIHVKSSWNTTVQNSTLRFGYSSGIWNDDSIDTHFVGNFITNNGLSPWTGHDRYSCGIRVTSGSPIIQRNSALSWGYGLCLTPTAPRAVLFSQIEDNLFDTNLNDNVILSGDGNIWGTKFSDNWNSYALWGHGWNLSNSNIRNLLISGGTTRENFGYNINISNFDRDVAIKMGQYTSAGRDQYTTLVNAIDASQATLVLADWQALAGTVITIGTEKIKCTTVAPVAGSFASFSGCARGFSSTTPAGHAAGATVGVRVEFPIGLNAPGDKNGGLQIIGNRFGNSDSLSANQYYGINLSIGSGSGSKYMITGNDLENNVGGPMVIYSTLTDSLISGNLPNSNLANFLQIPPGSAPGSSASVCFLGQLASDVNYIYVCTVAGTWKRVALTAF